MSFSSLARLTRQHAARLVVPPFLAFSVSLGSIVVPGTENIPGMEHATAAVSTMAPWSASKSSDIPTLANPVEAPRMYGPEVPANFVASVASVEPAAIASTPEIAAEPAPVEAPVAVAVQATRQPLAWGAVVSPAFVAKVYKMCESLGCEPNDLMAAMAFESVETFSPSVRNPMSGATGLIQFMSDTARHLGTSNEALAAMSAEEQLTYVEAYFQPYKGRLSNLSDVYMAILWPRAVGQSEDYPLFPSGSIQYAQNANLDVDGDGVVSKHEASGLVAAKLRKGLRSQYALIEAPVAGGTSARS